MFLEVVAVAVLLPVVLCSMGSSSRLALTAGVIRPATREAAADPRDRERDDGCEVMHVKRAVGAAGRSDKAGRELSLPPRLARCATRQQSNPPTAN